MGEKISLALIATTALLLIAAIIQAYQHKKDWEIMYMEYCTNPAIQSADEYRAVFNERMNEWCRKNGRPECF